MLLRGSTVDFLQLHDIKQRELREGIFGFTVRVPYESKLESQIRVTMCDNAWMNERSAVLVNMTLPEHLLLSTVQFDTVILHEEEPT
jgi:hypothetical protein